MDESEISFALYYVLLNQIPRFFIAFLVRDVIRLS